MSSDAERWDDGCSRCDYRNRFLIPSLTKFIERNGVGSVLDVGGGTGYIARKVALDPDGVRWTVLDRNPERVAIAQERCLGPQFSFVEADGFAEDGQQGPFDLVLLANTLLEMELDERVVPLINCVRPNGWLAVFMPDTLMDAVASLGPTPETIRRYKLGNLRLLKVDPFTGTEYPFVAHSPIDIVAAFVRMGLVLESLWTSGIADGHYFLAFKKSVPNA